MRTHFFVYEKGKIEENHKIAIIKKHFLEDYKEARILAVDQSNIEEAFKIVKSNASLRDTIFVGSNRLLLSWLELLKVKAHFLFDAKLETSDDKLILEKGIDIVKGTQSKRLFPFIHENLESYVYSPKIKPFFDLEQFYYVTNYYSIDQIIDLWIDVAGILQINIEILRGQKDLMLTSNILETILNNIRSLPRYEETNNIFARLVRINTPEKRGLFLEQTTQSCFARPFSCEFDYYSHYFEAYEELLLQSPFLKG